jgi:hypothetical protein
VTNFECGIYCGPGNVVDQREALGGPRSALPCTMRVQNYLTLFTLTPRPVILGNFKHSSPLIFTHQDYTATRAFFQAVPGIGLVEMSEDKCSSPFYCNQASDICEQASSPLR